MAKKNLTLDEKLEEAIVKAGPYGVPRNWVWSDIGNISVEIKNGTTIKQNKDEDGIKVTRIESLQNNTIDINRLGTIVEIQKLKEKDYYEDGDIALSHINSLEHVGKTALIDKTLLPLVHGMNLLRIRVNSNLVIPKFFQFYTRGYDYKDEVVDRVNRAVNQVSLNQKNLSDIPFPIPPLKEQQRIVDRIESLFEKLDKAKELIEEAREGFEKRKGSITSKVFRGKLNQRDGKLDIKIDPINSELYKIPDNWRWVKLRDVCEKITDGTHNSPQSYENGEYKYVTAKNIKEWGVDLSNITYLTKEDHDVIYKRCDVKYGDVLYIKDGATAGIATINKMNEEFSLLSSVALLRVNKHIINKYLYYLLNSFEIKKIILESVKGVAITRLTLKKINDIIIPLPPIDEQKEIVRILDKLLEEESKIEELTQLEEQIELIRKSILAKAFRGELGTNCEEDESALGLLIQLFKRERQG